MSTFNDFNKYYEIQQRKNIMNAMKGEELKAVLSLGQNIVLAQKELSQTLIEAINSDIQKLPNGYDKKGLQDLFKKVVNTLTQDVSADDLLHLISNRLNEESAIHYDKVFRNIELQALMEFKMVIEHAQVGLTMEHLNKMNECIRSLPSFFNKAALFDMCTELQSKIPQGRQQMFTQVKSTPAFENNLQRVIYNKTNQNIAKLSADQVIDLIHSLRTDENVFRAVIEHMNDNKDFLVGLALKAPVGSANKIFGSRLGRYLDNQQAATILYHHRVSIYPDQKNLNTNNVDLYVQYVDKVLGPCDKSIEKIMRDPEAKSILMKSRIYQAYEAQKAARSAPEPKERNNDIYQQNEQDIQLQEARARKRDQLLIENFVNENVNLYDEINKMNKGNFAIDHKSSEVEINNSLNKARRAVTYDHKNGLLNDSQRAISYDMIDKCKAILTDKEHKKNYDQQMRFDRPRAGRRI